MKFFSKIFNSTQKISKLEKEASDILELPNDLKALRVSNIIHIIDYSKNKIIDSFKDIYSSNPARATFQILTRLGSTNYNEYRSSINKTTTKDVWTCGFRDSEDRWVWYKNSEPKMTLSFKEACPNIEQVTDYVEKKIDFCSAKFGTSIIDKIKKQSFEEVSKEINALILENPYTTIKCGNCQKEENYTIDDLVDENRNAFYDSNYVICSECDTLVKLV